MTPASLPARPDLDQLRRQAKELKAAARAGDPEALGRLGASGWAGPPVTLSAAQLAIARSYGAASWPQLVALVEERLMDREQAARAFVVASVSNHLDRAARLLGADPSLAAHDLWAATALGEAAQVRRLLDRDPGAATRADPDTGWTPLLVACNSRWHHASPERGLGLRDVAEQLLDAGASPNTSVGSPSGPGHCSALYAAAGLANHPALAELLLSRGADPDTPAALYHTAFVPDHVGLRLLLAHGASAEGADALAAAITQDDAGAARLLLDAGIDASTGLPAEALGESYAPEPPVGALHAAVEFQCSAELVELLLAAGADPNGRGQDGRSAYQLAVRQGDTEIAARLAAHGAVDDARPVDRFLDACMRGERDSADRTLAGAPGLLDTMGLDDLAAMARAADRGDVAAVRLMAGYGFPIDAPVGDDGATALHAAAGAGAADVVAALLELGADIEASDTSWGATPLCWATVGSGFALGHAPHPDWVATVEALIDAGASTDGVWVAGKPPSDEVAAVLGAHGVEAPDDEDEDA